jgi:hypothetical protein
MCTENWKLVGHVEGLGVLHAVTENLREVTYECVQCCWQRVCKEKVNTLCKFRGLFVHKVHVSCLSSVYILERELYIIYSVKVKVPRNRPEGPGGGGRGIALLLLDLGARRGWVVSTTPRPLYPRERPGTHCTGGWVGPTAGLDVCEKSRPPTGIRSPDRPARSQSLYRLSYPGPILFCTAVYFKH